MIFLKEIKYDKLGTWKKVDILIIIILLGEYHTLGVGDIL